MFIIFNIILQNNYTLFLIPQFHIYWFEENCLLYNVLRMSPKLAQDFSLKRRKERLGKRVFPLIDHHHQSLYTLQVKIAVQSNRSTLFCKNSSRSQQEPLCCETYKIKINQRLCGIPGLDQKIRTPPRYESVVEPQLNTISASFQNT